jgi:hypothetical protein
MILRLRAIFNLAISRLDSTGFSVCVAPYVLHKHGSDLGQIACTNLFEYHHFKLLD